LRYYEAACSWNHQTYNSIDNECCHRGSVCYFFSYGASLRFVDLNNLLSLSTADYPALIGGVISQDSTWRWIFLLNVPCGVVALIIILLTWPSPRLPPGLKNYSVMKALSSHVDFIGALLLLMGTAILVFAMDQAGAAQYTWSSPTIIATFSASGICFLSFFGWIILLHSMGGKIPISPIIPVRVLTHRILASALLYDPAPCER
jgi:hypothetical protein